jgi:hypothetical protein
MLSIFSDLLSLMHVNAYSPEKVDIFQIMMMRWDPWDLKLTNSVSGNDSHLSRTIHTFPVRFMPSRAKPRRRPSMTQGLPLKRSLKHTFPKTKRQNVVQEAKTRAATVLNPNYGGAARI